MALYRLDYIDWALIKIKTDSNQMVPEGDLVRYSEID